MTFLLDLFSNPEIVLRLIVSVLLGGLIGLERTLAHKRAGLRTFALVSLGACAFVILGVTQTPGALERILANILIGIGFLGGGIVFTQRDTTKGLTTAAALWTTTSIGAAVGLGYYGLAIWITLLVITLLYLIGRWELSLKKNIEKENE